jgi:hypothetical protein
MTNDIILLDYYEGAYGPTIRIDVKSKDTLKKLKNLFLELAGPEEKTINMAEMNGVSTLELKKLILRRTSDSKELGKKLMPLSCSSSEHAFEWVMTAREWGKAATLVDGLLDYNMPGHQYLTHEGVDDILVELAFME